MTIPERVNAGWIATLGDPQLVAAESRLHADFIREENAEKRRRGSRYVLLHGPAPLINAWIRWLMVSNEARSRGLVVNHKS